MHRRGHRNLFRADCEGVSLFDTLAFPSETLYNWFILLIAKKACTGVAEFLPLRREISQV